MFGLFGRVLREVWRAPGAPQDDVLQERRFEYDEGGNVKRVTEREASTGSSQGGVKRELRADFDWKHRPVATFRNAPNLAEVRVYRRGELAAVVDEAGRIERMEHDGFGRLRSVTSPGGIRRTLGWDYMDNLVAVVDGNGNETRYGYDAFGRRTRVETPGTGATTYTFRDDDQVLSMADGQHHLDDQTIQYIYEPELGRRIGTELW